LGFVPPSSFEPGEPAGQTQPIFEGGTLLHRTRTARAAYEEAAAQYRSAVIAACQNVADALRVVQSDANALTAAVAVERAAATTLNITRRQLELSQVAYLLFINAENTYEQAIISLVQARAARYAVAAANRGKGPRPSGNRLRTEMRKIRGRLATLFSRNWWWNVLAVVRAPRPTVSEIATPLDFPGVPDGPPAT